MAWLWNFFILFLNLSNATTTSKYILRPRFYNAFYTNVWDIASLSDG
jgi:hypothetical protein